MIMLILTISDPSVLSKLIYTTSDEEEQTAPGKLFSHASGLPDGQLAEQEEKLVPTAPETIHPVP